MGLFGTTIWEVNAGMVSYSVEYSAERPDPYGTEVRIQFFIEAYLNSGSYFNYPLHVDAMWTAGTNRYSGNLTDNYGSAIMIGKKIPDSPFSVWTDKDYVTGVRCQMSAPRKYGNVRILG